MDMKINLKRHAQFEAPADVIRTRLSDLPSLLGLFPKLDHLREIKAGAYQWTLKPIGAAGVSHVVVYGAQYTVDLQAMKVSWTAVKGVGNAHLEGWIHFRENGGGIDLTVHIEGQLREMSIPLALRLVTPTYINKTFEALVDKFIERLRENVSA